jgi:maltose 6'-phosphate phosphatase
MQAVNISLLLFLLLLSGCTKDKVSANQQPQLTVTHSADGLTITVKGGATDTDGTVAEVSIDWGDQRTEYLSTGEYAAFETSHLYANPATFNIRITVRDDSGNTAEAIIPVNVDFKETSLEGIKPGMFKTTAGEYLILTINLHTYQESRQSEKFNMIADVIGKMDIDFIAFQECAQHKDAAIHQGIIRKDNMALIISDRIMEKYQVQYDFAWNWAHYGWTVWEEGVAVLSKYPVVQSEDRYVSQNTNTGSITSRKVIWASCQSPDGLFNIFSAHIHWRTSVSDEEQNNQVRNIQIMVDGKDSLNTDAFSLVCGDFNGNPTSEYPWSEGYNTMMRKGDYTDSFLEMYPDANQKPALSKYNTIGGDLPGRIDYVFMKKHPRLKVMDSQIIFTGDVVGTVSDHFGVLTRVAVIN